MGAAVLLAAAAVGCGEETADYMTWTKAVAAELGGRSGDVDVCHARGWYGDGTCDTFCPAPDKDCEPPATVCMTGADCATGERCDTSDCLSCCPGAPAGSPCIAACCGVCREDAPPYVPCKDNAQCDAAAGEVCDMTECLSCCPDAPPGSDCIALCCGRCTPAPTATCAADADCTAGEAWCEGGVCVPCDNSGLACKIYCEHGMVPPRNGCQPCICAAGYTACTGDLQCDAAAGEVCDMTECLSCCPDAPPGSDCIALCCGRCTPAPTATCAADADCTAGEEWCEGGVCVPCDNSGLACKIYCEHGMVPPRNGCQPCICAAGYTACTSDLQCDAAAGEVCDMTECLSCCPDAPPGTPCIALCCGRCTPAPTATCAADADCTAGEAWCEGGVCVPCDNSGLACLLYCEHGMVPPRNGCQPCICAAGYTACMGDEHCPERCDMTECLSCCPDAPPGTPCIDACCGRCVPWGP
jgi:hypothetical protein